MYKNNICDECKKNSRHDGQIICEKCFLESAKKKENYKCEKCGFKTLDRKKWGQHFKTNQHTRQKFKEYLFNDE